MSLFVLPTTQADLVQLQNGLQFSSNQAQALAQSNAINAPGSTTSVFTTAASILNANISLSQVAMATTALMEGGTIAVGDTTTANTLTFLTTQFLPAQVASAIANNFNPTVYAAEALGSALATNASFNANFVGLSVSQFATSVSTLTGVNANAVQQFVSNWTAFFTANPSALQGRTVTQASYGAAFGDAVGVALLNDTTANLHTVFSTNTSDPTNTFSPNVVKGSVANALIDVATGQYTTGVALGALPAHTLLQGEFTPGGVVVNLTPGKDTVVISQNNTTVNGTLGGAGQTWTPGDTIKANPGVTGAIFNITGNGTGLGSINPTTVGPGNVVNGVETVNVMAATALGALSTTAVQGDFTATGSQGEWTGLKQLNITSGGNLTAADNVTVGAATKVLINDTMFAPTASALTVNGSLTTTINETNLFANAGITVNGGSGTTTVSITQTEIAPLEDGVVKITDVNGASTTAAGTITTITLDGLSHSVGHTFTSPGVGLVLLGPAPNTIVDNALSTLTINNSDSAGAAVSITDNLTTPTATTLNLNLSHDGVAPGVGFPAGTPAGFGIVTSATTDSALILVDTKNEISTIHLSLGNSNSFLHLLDNGLVTLDTAKGSGALVGDHGSGAALGHSTITDNVNTGVNFNFSGLNGPNDIDVDRVSGVNNDVFTLGDFGTNAAGANTFSTAQHLVIENTNINNTDTINFGSGAYLITDAAHPTTNNPHHYVNTAANGAGIVSGFPTTNQWAEITNVRISGNPALTDTLQFSDSVQNTFNIGPQGSVAAGIAAALANPAHSATVFSTGGNTYVFDHVGTSAISVSAADAMVEFVGVIFNNASTAPGGIIHL